MYDTREVFFLLYKKKSRIKRIIICVLSVILVISILFFCLFEFKARQLIHNLVGNELEIHAMNSIDSAVSQVLDDMDIDYSNLISISETGDGNIASLAADTIAINKLKAQLSLKITEKIRNDTSITVGVPSGAFTGLVLLSELGPDIHVSLRMGGSVITTIKSEFTSAGINQTIHRIYLYVDSDVSLTCPIIDYDCKIETVYELCHTVIVGNTPSVFANIG